MTIAIQTSTAARPKNAHTFAKAKDNFYLEPEWCSQRLVKVEKFAGLVWDPFCGTGRVVKAAKAAGYQTHATDIVDRGYTDFGGPKDVLTVDRIDPQWSIAGNPPFVDEILQHVIMLNPLKAALIWPTARLTAACGWLSTAPLARVWQMTPRPAMPPGEYVLAGNKPGGARVEHCWLVFERGHRGPARLGWLHRELRLRMEEHYELMGR
jgi:hypothetical protein